MRVRKKRCGSPVGIGRGSSLKSVGRHGASRMGLLDGSEGEVKMLAKFHPQFRHGKYQIMEKVGCHPFCVPRFWFL